MSFWFRISKTHVSSIIVNQFWWPYAIISLLVVLVYFPTFSGTFILDDHSLVQNNPYIRQLRPITSYFAQEDGLTDVGDAGSYHTGYYRPLINVTYWLDYKLWGMSAPGFRTTNLILHVLTCLLLFKVLMSLVNNRKACFLATVLFALHPVNTESVSWVTSRNNILVTLFSLSAIYFYIKGWENESMKAQVFSVMCFILAILSKEFGLMVLPMFFLYQRFLGKDRKNITKEVSWYILFGIILILYFILRKSVTTSLLTPSEMEAIWTRVYFFPYLILVNLRLILFPYGLHSFVIDYPDAYFGWEAIAGFLACILLGLFIWRERRERIVSFSLLSFFISIAPILNIIPTSAVTLISMRWLYFPMAFFSIAVSRFIQRLMRINRIVTLACIGLVSLYFGAYSYLLNKELFHDEDTFFEQEVVEFHNYFYAGGFAENLLDKRNYREAEQYFRLAIKNYPNRAKNYINYSALLIEAGRIKASLISLNKAKSLTMTRSERGEWFNNLGMVHFKLGKRDEAIRNFKEAVLLNPKEAQFWANLGGAYGSRNDYQNSLMALKKGLEMAPGSLKVRKNLAVTYIRMKEYDKAISLLEEISPKERAEMGISGLLLKARKARALSQQGSEPNSCIE